ncbi:hypothetical protein GCM10009128_25170 [Psychrosphaera haliotis]
MSPLNSALKASLDDLATLAISPGVMESLIPVGVTFCCGNFQNGLNEGITTNITVAPSKQTTVIVKKCGGK